MRWLLLLVATTSSARADIVHLSATVEDGTPRLEAIVSGQPARAVARTADGRTFAATGMRSFAEGTASIAIAIVYESSVFDRSVCTGVDALPALAIAIEELDLGALAPANSEITLVSYTAGARVEVPFRPLGELRADWFGTHAHHPDAIGTDLRGGIELGLEQLEAHTDAPIRLLAVIGDSSDDDAAVPALRDLKKRAARANVRTAFIIHSTAVSPEGDVVAKVFRDATRASSPDAIAAALQAAFARATDRTYVTFASRDLPWDGGEHEITIHLDGVEYEPAVVFMPRLGGDDRGSLAGVALVSMFALLVLIAIRKRYGCHQPNGVCPSAGS